MSETHIERLLWQRKSARAYLETPVPQADVARILRAARRAPSGANLQPGAFHALTGKPFGQLKQELAGAIASGRPIVSGYSYFPDPMPAHLKARQRAAGYALYQALGIDRRDSAARRAQFDLNYRFFDAPVGIVVTIQKDMGKGCFMDLGMSLMALFLAAEDLGYATSGIGALANYADVTHEALGLADDELVVCGIALGVADRDAPVNNFRTEREALDAYAIFRGFAP
ncbi:nitroreductase family protein [Pseudogemmobacter sp. W21_MBD1_M6]|uniref:nitroreductase family protein n=1 Tax=Pseudogemmobacter sp. W21_MBD1_M6 TaxID=3240271 RepID=UPI003F9B6745